MKEFRKMLKKQVEKLESLINYNIGDKNARLIYQSLRNQKSNQGTGKAGKKAKGGSYGLYAVKKSDRNGSGGCII